MDELRPAPNALCRWLEALGPVRDFGDLLAMYRRDVGPVDAEALREWLRRDAGVVVSPVGGRLVLPDDWPTSRPALH